METIRWEQMHFCFVLPIQTPLTWFILLPLDCIHPLLPTHYSTWLFPSWIQPTINLENLGLSWAILVTSWCLMVAFLICTHLKWKQFKLVVCHLSNLLRTSSAQALLHWRRRSLNSFIVPTVWIVSIKTVHPIYPPAWSIGPDSTKVQEPDINQG